MPLEGIQEQELIARLQGHEPSVPPSPVSSQVPPTSVWNTGDSGHQRANVWNTDASNRSTVPLKEIQEREVKSIKQKKLPKPISQATAPPHTPKQSKQPAPLSQIQEEQRHRVPKQASKPSPKPASQRPVSSPWGVPVVTTSQPKSLREIQEEEARKLASGPTIAVRTTHTNKPQKPAQPEDNDDDENFWDIPTEELNTDNADKNQQTANVLESNFPSLGTSGAKARSTQTKPINQQFTERAQKSHNNNDKQPQPSIQTGDAKRANSKRRKGKKKRSVDPQLLGFNVDLSSHDIVHNNE